MPAYSFSSGGYSDSDLRGFFIASPWSLGKDGVISWNKSHFTLLVSSDSDAGALAVPGAENWGNGTLHGPNGGSLSLNDCVRVGASYGEYGNERGPGFIHGTFGHPVLNGWVDPAPKGWNTQGNCDSGHKRLIHKFSWSDAVQPNPIELDVCSPRLEWKASTNFAAGSVCRYFSDDKIIRLLSSGARPTGWKILSCDVTPDVGMQGFHLICHGPFRQFGWHQFHSLNAALREPTNEAVLHIVAELCSVAGPLPRNLLNCDDDKNFSNQPELNEPAIEVLYIRRFEK